MLVNEITNPQNDFIHLIKTINMKITSFIFACLMFLGTTIANAQQVEMCSGDKSQRMDLMSKSVVFNQVGINLNKYDWNNPNINCHINETILNLKSRNNYNYLAGTGAGIGLGMLAGGAYTVGSRYLDGGGGLIVGGALVTGASIYLLTLAAKKKKKHNHHLNQVNQYYRSQGLF